MDVLLNKNVELLYGLSKEGSGVPELSWYNVAIASLFIFINSKYFIFTLSD
jgi:hypothetical protein